MLRERAMGRVHTMVSMAACAVIGIAIAFPAGAESPPLFLLLERAPVDQAAGQGACVRGTLFAVHSLDAPAGPGRIRIGDTLELPGATHTRMPAGRHRARAVENDEGWTIEVLWDAERVVVGADPRQSGDVSLLLLGRHRHNVEDDCRRDRRPLEDADVLLRRLRRVYASPANERPIELLVR